MKINFLDLRTNSILLSSNDFYLTAVIIILLLYQVSHLLFIQQLTWIISLLSNHSWFMVLWALQVNLIVHLHLAFNGNNITLKTANRFCWRIKFFRHIRPISFFPVTGIHIICISVTSMYLFDTQNHLIILSNTKISINKKISSLG